MACKNWKKFESNSKTVGLLFVEIHKEEINAKTK